MSNAFLLVRFVFFALAVFLSLLTVIFSVLHIVAAKDFVPGASVFLILNSCLLFVFVTLAFAQHIFPNIKTANIILECAWTAIISVLQLAAAIDATVNGPPVMCQSGAPLGLCAYSYLLVPVSWFSSLTVFSYFLVLLVAAVVHARTHTFLYSSTVYSISWSVEPTPQEQKEDPQPQVSDPASSVHSKGDSHSTLQGQEKRWSKARGDEESRLESLAPPSRKSATEHSLRPSWAKSIRTKRGVDQPFVRREDSGATRTRSSFGRTLELPAQARVRDDKRPDDRDHVEPSSENAPTSGPRMHLPPLRIQRGPKLALNDPFPEDTPDPNLPLSLPRLSEWIRADAALGINIHTVPPISP